MRFQIDSDPIAKARPRFSYRGGHTSTYDPQKAEKEAVKLELMSQFKNALNSCDKQYQMQASSLSRGVAFKVKMCFHIKVPNSLSEPERNSKLWGLEECIVKPDLDNLEKFYLDCCSNILFADDKQVFSLSSTKKYSVKPRVVIDIMPKDESPINSQVHGILKIFGPERLISFINDMWELFELYDVDEDNDFVSNEVGEENCREVRLARTAYLLSLVASNHSKALEKIQKKFPDFWKQAEKIEREVSSFQEKILENALKVKNEF